MPAPIVEVPTISFADFESEQGFEAIASRIREAGHRTGFFVLKDHGIAPELCDETLAVCKRLFDLPVEEKLKLNRDPWTSRGYDQLANQSFGEDGRPDQKEGFQFGSDGFEPNEYWRDDGTKSRYGHGPNKYPPAEVLPGLEGTMKDYTTQMLALARKVLAAMAASLGVDRTYFDQLCHHPIGGPRALHYPPSRASEQDIGAGAHYDFGVLTLLATDDVEGLEIQTQDKDWIGVTAPRGSFIVNIGDLGSLYSGGEYLSSMHRVINRSSVSRYSLPFFVDGNSDVVVAPIKGSLASVDWEGRDVRTLSVEEHMRERFDSSYNIATGRKVRA